MNIATIIVLVLIAAGIWAAIKTVRNHKGGSCEGCTQQCCKRIK